MESVHTVDPTLRGAVCDVCTVIVSAREFKKKGCVPESPRVHREVDRQSDGK